MFELTGEEILFIIPMYSIGIGRCYKMKQYIYADHAATTPISEKAKEAMLAAMDRYGNPSSFHREGQLAKEALEQARSEIADCLHAKQEEIYFTSGGSEADKSAAAGGEAENEVRGHYTYRQHRGNSGT